MFKYVMGVVTGKGQPDISIQKVFKRTMFLVMLRKYTTDQQQANNRNVS